MLVEEAAYCVSSSSDVAMVTVVQAPTATAESSARAGWVNNDASDVVMRAAALNSMIAPVPERAAILFGRERPRPSNLPRLPARGSDDLTEKQSGGVAIETDGPPFSDPDVPPAWACRE
jgi:hypothetical protein